MIRGISLHFHIHLAAALLCTELEFSVNIFPTLIKARLHSKKSWCCCNSEHCSTYIVTELPAQAPHTTWLIWTLKGFQWVRESHAGSADDTHSDVNTPRLIQQAFSLFWLEAIAATLLPRRVTKNAFPDNAYPSKSLQTWYLAARSESWRQKCILLTFIHSCPCLPCVIKSVEASVTQ